MSYHMCTSVDVELRWQVMWQDGMVVLGHKGSPEVGFTAAVKKWQNRERRAR